VLELAENICPSRIEVVDGGLVKVEARIQGENGPAFDVAINPEAIAQVRQWKCRSSAGDVWRSVLLFRGDDDPLTVYTERGADLLRAIDRALAWRRTWPNESKPRAKPVTGAGETSP
jgi:hypothetical protein